MVTYNRLDYTKLALESVLSLDYPGPWSIVLFDNASSDGTVPYLQQRLSGESRARLILSPANRGIVYPMNDVWFSDRRAELLAKIDNDTWVPPDLIRRLAECHQRSRRFGVLSGFHFRAEGEALADDSRVSEFDGVRVLAQPYVGGCAVMVRREVVDRLGPIPCRSEGQPGPLMDSGWTFYQQRMTDEGLINGYPWPPIHVDHMEDTRSPRCVRTPEHQEYKRALRGMSLEQFTEELCVWRPMWDAQGTGDRLQGTGGEKGFIGKLRTHGDPGVVRNGVHPTNSYLVSWIPMILSLKNA
jgi:glycosyltransferase involved in cell wall biosynthesis